MNKIIHEICSLINLLDINGGFGLILMRFARYTGSVTGFRDTRLGQVAKPKGPKDEPPFMQKNMINRAHQCNINVNKKTCNDGKMGPGGFGPSRVQV